MPSEEVFLASLKALVDKTASRLQNEISSQQEAEDLIAETRETAAKIVPDQMEKYDLIYGARFARLVEQFVKPRQQRKEASDASELDNE